MTTSNVGKQSWQTTARQNNSFVFVFVFFRPPIIIIIFFSRRVRIGNYSGCLRDGNPDVNAKSSSLEVKINTTRKNSSLLVSNRKQLHPLVGGPYRDSMRLYALSEPPRTTNKNTVVQRVTSAKMLRVKQLQNQLTDAHYHLNELANENRLLKALQKRQDSALKRYEGTNAELPRIINSHHEELKVLQTKHKKLRAQHKHTCDLLKEKENEIHSLQTQNKHLIQLSKDRHLEEREKLQMRVSDLNFRIEQQQETIQTLNRKLALESKSLKHQLNAEMAKHKETQKNLHEALDKLKNFEDMLDNREKRLYNSGRLPVCNKGKSVVGQSLANLGNNGRISNPLKSGGKNRGSQNDLENGSLPKLTVPETNEGRTIPYLKTDQDATSVTETMSSLQQVRKFRLQKSYSRNGSAGRPSDLEKSEEDETRRSAKSGTGRSSLFERAKPKSATMNDDELADEEVKRFVEDFETTNGKGPYKLPKQLRREFGYSSSDSESDEVTKINGAHDSTSMTNKSRDLHNRLIGDETIAADSIVAKFPKKKNASTTSESESDSETDKTKTPSIAKQTHVVAVQRRSSMKIDDATSNLTTTNFLKLDINATDSEPETETLRKINDEKTDLSFEISTAEIHENSQKRLMSITQSWTKLQEKIKRDREISRKQLKAFDDEITTNCSLEKKLNDAVEKENLEDQRRFSIENYEKTFDDDSFGRSTERPKKSENDDDERSVDGNSRIFRTPPNVATEDLKIRKNETLAAGSDENVGRRAINEEFPSSVKNVDDSIDAALIPTNFQDVKKSSSDESQKIAIGENGVDNDAENGSTDVKIVNYNKQKLLAAMKAIDDNDNIEFTTNPKNRASGNFPIRSQSTITENLYRGVPTHARKKDDILKEIFGDAKNESKLRAGCSKLH